MAPDVRPLPLLLSFLFLPAVAADVTTRRMEGRVFDGGENANSLPGSVGKKEILLTHTSRKFPYDQIIFFDLRFYTLLRFEILSESFGNSLCASRVSNSASPPAAKERSSKLHHQARWTKEIHHEWFIIKSADSPRTLQQKKGDI